MASAMLLNKASYDKKISNITGEGTHNRRDRITPVLILSTTAQPQV